MTLPDDTLSAEDKAMQTEQQQIAALPDDQRAEAPTDRQEPAPQPDKTVQQEERVDPRAARMEKLAERSYERQTEEVEQSREAIVGPAREPVQSEPVPERKLKIKVRGEERELTESEVIALAQKNDAGDSYLTEARNILEDVKRAARQPEPQQQRQEPETRIDRLAEAVEKIQLGADPAEVRALLDTEMTERVTRALDDRENASRTRTVEQAFDDDLDAGYAAFDAEHKDVAADPIARAVVTSLAGGMQSEIIARFLASGATDEQKSAFANAGITAEGVRRYSPQDANALYKDMAIKGYPLPKPAVVIQAAGKTVAERFAATTQRPAPTPQPTPQVNRQERKAAIQQPERTPIPRSPGGNPPPKSENERAQASRNDMKAERRAGAPRR